MNAALVFVRTRIATTRIFAVMFLLLLGVSLEGWRNISPLLEHSLQMGGWVLIAAGVIGRLWCGSYINGKKYETLVTSGPYSVCRNPLYFFSFLGGLGVMLTTETLTLPLIFCCAFALYYRKVIAREEQALRSLHGAAYEDYCQRVPRFLPNFRLLEEPATYTVSARLFRRSLFDVSWFILAGGMIEFVESLHVSGLLPTLLTIY